MTVSPTSPDQEKSLSIWLRDIFRPQPDRDYFLRLARLVESSAPVACPACS